MLWRHTFAFLVFFATFSVVYGLNYEVVATHPHDPTVFTQGLLFDPENQSELLESGGGLYSKSTLRRVTLSIGIVSRIVEMDSSEFAEGIAVIQDKIYQVTWRSKTVHVYDKNTLTHIRDFTNPVYDGWAGV